MLASMKIPSFPLVYSPQALFTIPNRKLRGLGVAACDIPSLSYIGIRGNRSASTQVGCA